MIPLHGNRARATQSHQVQQEKTQRFDSNLLQSPFSVSCPVHPPSQLNLLKTRAVSTGRCNTGLQFTRGSLKAQSFPWALIEAQGYFVEVGLRVGGQVGFLREVLSQ